MIVRVSCSTNNFSTLPNDIHLLNFLFTSNLDVLNRDILTDEFKKLIGQLAIDTYRKGPYFYLETEYNSIGEELSEKDLKILRDNTLLYFTIIESFISFLWLIKDNCCSINSVYTHLVDKKKAILTNIPFI